MLCKLIHKPWQSFIANILTRRRHSHSKASPTASELRKIFLNHFAASNHCILPSTTVLPHNDPTLAFVNAGMNQFKDIFLGNAATDLKRATNVQKCIRLNDIDLVGSDGHHLTFFEMMGSWSFGDYYKLEACELALNLLTSSFKIPQERLIFTYYGGCKVLGIEADVETKNIWLSLGVPEIQIKEDDNNFWEMGLTGPCGPCTEIHYISNDGAPLEIWNIVFMELNRLADGLCVKLPTNHVDTGMGLERLAAILSGSNSNYDTELFMPIFRRLEALSKKQPYSGKFLDPDHIDRGYRVLADHSRMISVALADEVFPGTSPRLRNVMRRAFRACRTYFDYSGPEYLTEICHDVGDLLGDQYPNIPRGMLLISDTIRAEYEHLLHMEHQGHKILPQLLQQFPRAQYVDILDVPAFNEALKYLSKAEDSVELSSIHALKLYDTFGLSVENIKDAFDILGRTFNEDGLLQELSTLKHKSKTRFEVGSTLLDGIDQTDDSFKYGYSTSNGNNYVFKTVTANVIGLTNSDGKRVDKLLEGDEKCSIFLDKTGFYAEQGGQVGDTGTIYGQEKEAKFRVVDCQRMSGQRVAHIGDVLDGEINVGQSVELILDKRRRIACMQNHTGTHLLNAALHSLFPHVYQRSSNVGADGFRFDVHVVNARLTTEVIDKLESIVNNAIAESGKLKRRNVKTESMSGMSNLITLSGEKYPDEATIIELPNSTREPCCGTHVFNTGDVRAFTIVHVKTARTGVTSFTCLTGEAAMRAREKGLDLVDFVSDIVCVANELGAEEASDNVAKIQAKIEKKMKEVNKTTVELPHTLREGMSKILKELCDHFRSMKRSEVKEKLVGELDAALKTNISRSGSSAGVPLVHVFRHCDAKVDLTRLQKLCGTSRPVLLVAAGGKHGGGVRAKAYVPKHLVRNGFDATLWMSVAVSEAFEGKAEVRAPRGQNAEQVCNMIHLKEYFASEEELLQIVRRAENFALNACSE